jgi:hypothetical protein
MNKDFENAIICVAGAMFKMIACLDGAMLCKCKRLVLLNHATVILNMAK